MVSSEHLCEQAGHGTLWANSEQDAQSAYCPAMSTFEECVSECISLVYLPTSIHLICLI